MADGWTFEIEAARAALLSQMRAQSLRGFGLEDRQAATCAAGALVQYLRETQKAELSHVRDLIFRTGADSMVIDPTTLRNLEVIEAADGGEADRCFRKSIARSPRWADGCCAHGCFGRCSRWSGSRIGWTRSRNSHSAAPNGRRFAKH